MNRRREDREIGNHPIVEELYAVPDSRSAGRMHARRAEAHEHADPAAGARLVIPDGAFGRHATLAQTLSVRAEADAVGERQRSETLRREEQGEGFRHKE